MERLRAKKPGVLPSSVRPYPSRSLAGPGRDKEVPDLHVNLVLGILHYRVFARRERFLRPDLEEPVGDLLAKYFNQVEYLSRLVDHSLNGNLLHYAIAFVLAHTNDSKAFVFGKTEIEFRTSIRRSLGGVRAVKLERRFS